MGKRHQNDPMDNDNDSTESCDENQNSSCPHIAKAVDFNKIKKSLNTGLCTDCPQCSKSPPENGLDSDYEYDLSLWLCLRCGNQACGRSRGKHALEHFTKPRSDCHALCVNTTLWTVWCYECDSMISPLSRKKLHETVEWLKKQNQVVKRPIIALGYREETFEDKSGDITTLEGEIPRVRGLTNLGNTCFFNSVLQCLAQTPFLLPVLNETSAAGESFTLPGGNLILDSPPNNPSTTKPLPALSGILSSWGPLTEVLSHTLTSLTCGRADVHNPRALLAQLSVKQPLFGGGDQHDAHELLRFLLEAVRSEDLRRYQVVILEKLGFSKKTDPSTVEGFTKQVIKFYGTQASDLMVRTDQVFRGILVSTLQCQDCKHSSLRDEFFLDLSLPVSCDKPTPPSLRRKSSIEDSPSPSKYQLKKEKRLARKARKLKPHPSGSSSPSTLNEDDSKNNSKSSSESDADVEDNLEDGRLESGYNSEKTSDASPEQEGDSGVVSPKVGAPPSPEESEGAEDYERPISRLSFADKPMIEDKIRLDHLAPRFLGPRYQADEGECSVQSCLNQFTSCELLTGNNRVRCENCTSQSNEAGKSVYTNATKQLLVSSPPAVLILHLKRFQVSRCFPRKMCKHVSFPLLLDLSPFCIRTPNSPPTLLYSLYGIVEHSGTMHGGHYVAYVKARAPLTPDNYRWGFLHPSRTAGPNDNKQPPQGKWYYVSDSYVAEVPEGKVLKAQAYLLFYERVA